LADIMRVKAVSSGFTGAPGFHQFYFGVAVPPVNAPAAVLACNRVRDAYTAAKALWPATWSITIDAAVDVIDPATGTLTGVLAGATSTVVGTSSAGGFYAAPTGMITRWYTGEVADGHLVRGRTFHVPLANALQNNDGTPDSSIISLSNAFGTAMMNAGATDCVFGLWHRPRKAKVGPPPVTARAGSFHGVTVRDTPDKFVVLRSRRD
jgi:hypothetical protein